MSPNTQLEQEKRVRREIANSNERRRMQSINTGFQSLKILIPHSCGEKLSKVCFERFDLCQVHMSSARHAFFNELLTI